MPVGHFLVGIGALIWDKNDNKYLLLKRSADKDVGAGEWECPTGRVEQGESIQEALVREVDEELQVTAHPQFIIGTTHFYRGEVRPENELVGILYACEIATPADIRISAEHSEARWMTREEVDAFLPDGHWLKWVIRRAELMRSGTSAELKALFLEEGFETQAIRSE